MDGSRNADLVVVGAGPAGMGTAYYAARLGLNVALLEKERFPRDRVCADGMLARTVSEMERLGLMQPVFERCQTDARLRRTLTEALVGNTGASALLRRRPGVVAVRKATARGA